MKPEIDPVFLRLVKEKKISPRGYSGNEGRLHPNLFHPGYFQGRRHLYARAVVSKKAS